MVYTIIIHIILYSRHLICSASIELTIFKDKSLGIGSFGEVFEADYYGRKCAAKIIHPIFFAHGSLPIQQFARECKLLKNLRHENIVDYINLHTNPQTRVSTLVMEFMTTNLTSYLEQSSVRLPLFHQIDILHDISKAVSFLHRKQIIHRDLSSNNILLSTHAVKVSDFGTSRVFDAQCVSSRLTLCPGTQVYMPPEARDEQPSYTQNLDCFSLGVIGVQLFTRRFPAPGPENTKEKDERSPTGTIHIPVSEVQRRKSDLDQIPEDHPCKCIILKCLKDESAKRLSAEEMHLGLDEIQNSRPYWRSLRESNGGESIKYNIMWFGEYVSTQRLVMVVIALDISINDI